MGLVGVWSQLVVNTDDILVQWNMRTAGEEETSLEMMLVINIISSNRFHRESQYVYFAVYLPRRSNMRVIFIESVRMCVAENVTVNHLQILLQLLM